MSPAPVLPDGWTLVALQSVGSTNDEAARLAETGADGLVPVSSLGDEYFVHDDRAHALIGDRSGRRWRLGREVTVRLREATPVTGGLLFEMLSEPEGGEAGAPRRRGPSR